MMGEGRRRAEVQGRGADGMETPFASPLEDRASAKAFSTPVKQVRLNP